MTIGETNINLIFDLLIPADCKMCAKDAEKAVAENFKTELYKDYKKAPKAKFYPDVLARKPFYPKILTWGD